jgi:long-chain acyl-CoA synthetase
MTLPSLLFTTARCFPDLPAVSVGDRRVYTYGEYGSLAARLAGGLIRFAGLAPGDRVALAMSNTPEFLAVLFAVWRAGLVAVPVNARLHPREIAQVVHDCGARVCLATPDLAGPLAALLAPEVGLFVDGEADWRRLACAEPAGAVDRRPEDPAWIFYTSGTTGRPKGAVLTCRSLLAMALGYLADVDRPRAGDAFLHLSAQSHATGLFGLSHVAVAAHHVLPASGGFDPGELADLVDRYVGVTLFVPPTGLRRLLRAPAFARAPVDHLRSVLLGAAPVHVSDVKAGYARFGPRLWNGYGQGESPCTITALSKDLLAAAAEAGDEGRLASVGVARTGVEVAIVDPDDRPVPPGELGEVVVRGETVMAGYWNAPEATGEVLRGGWLHTGDVGALDERGFLTLRDRSKDVIISGGLNIYPREVEDVLLEDPDVAEVAVVGVPDAEWGESPVAVVVPVPGAVPDVARLERRCLERIARFKRPRHWRVVDALPKNAAGKVLKRQLRDRYAAETGATPATPGAR